MGAKIERAMERAERTQTKRLEVDPDTLERDARRGEGSTS
ncbi:hypothetical protein JOD65_000071 [Nocardioides cavernae]|nr:hypothetical protein [Nocardioides cavernae]